MDLAEARSSPSERERIADLMSHVPAGTGSVLDVGARDGYLSIELARLVDHVVALDLTVPDIAHPRVTTVAGDATSLQFPDGSFDLVLCAEVLEHLESPALEAACRELVRVSRGKVLIGVPYKQDTRFGRLTCHACGHRNPPWGHVSTFDQERLQELFPALAIRAVSFVGENRNRTNFLSAALNDVAGNPWGPYWQEEPCIACGVRMVRPVDRGPGARVASRAAHVLNTLQRPFVRTRATWIHILFSMKNTAR